MRGETYAEVGRLGLVAAVSPGIVLALDAVVERVGVGLGFVRVYLSVGSRPFTARNIGARLEAGVPAALHDDDDDAEHDRRERRPHV